MKKIMFNDRYGLTQSVLNATKTMTRRICKEQYWSFSDIVAAKNGIFHFEKPKYKVGEIVAIAQQYSETGKTFGDYGDPEFKKKKVPEWGNLKAMKGWNNKMFVRADLMPHRIRITDIKVERLQDISEKDCLKEGIKNSFIKSVERYYMYTYPHAKSSYHTPREAFAALIDKVSGKGTWDSNPWVFAYTFELVK